MVRITGGANPVHYYLDPLTGQLLNMADENGRWYRWLHSGLHQLDFTHALRTRPLWDVLMLILLAGAASIALTGAYIGIRRLQSGRLV